MNDGLLRLQPAAKTFAVGDLQATEAEIQTAERVRVQELLRFDALLRFILKGHRVLMAAQVFPTCKALH